MRVVSVMILVSLLSACSAPWHAENRFPRPKPGSRPASPALIPARTTAVTSPSLSSTNQLYSNRCGEIAFTLFHHITRLYRPLTGQ